MSNELEVYAWDKVKIEGTPNGLRNHIMFWVQPLVGGNVPEQNILDELCAKCPIKTGQTVTMSCSGMKHLAPVPERRYIEVKGFVFLDGSILPDEKMPCGVSQALVGKFETTLTVEEVHHHYMDGLPPTRLN